MVGGDRGSGSQLRASALRVGQRPAASRAGPQMEPSSPSPGFWGFPTVTPPAAVRDSLGPFPQVCGAHLQGLQSSPVSRESSTQLAWRALTLCLVGGAANRQRSCSCEGQQAGQLQVQVCEVDRALWGAVKPMKGTQSGGGAPLHGG